MKIMPVSAVVLWLCLETSSLAYAEGALSRPNWDRTLAVETAHQQSLVPELQQLFQLARSGQDALLVQSLNAIEQDSNLPVPVREQALFRFAVGLADLDPDSVGPAVLQHLLNYQPRVIVSHEELDTMGVPLFNIRAATHGVRNSWARRKAENRAQRFSSEQTGQWIDSYLASSPQERKGFVDALDYASDAELMNLSKASLVRLSDHPELTTVAGKSALLMRDSQALEHLLVTGRGPQLSGILAAAVEKFSEEEIATLHQTAIRSAPPESAALAIAHLSPALGNHAGTRKLLIDLLRHPELGSAAALALAGYSDPEIKAVLLALTASEDPLAASRASLALELSTNGRVGGAQR